MDKIEAELEAYESERFCDECQSVREGELRIEQMLTWYPNWSREELGRIIFGDEQEQDNARSDSE